MKARVAQLLYPGLMPGDAWQRHEAQLRRVMDALAAAREHALLAAAREQRMEAENVPDTDQGTHADGHRCAADFLERRAAQVRR
jgi:hypothetical protein